MLLGSARAMELIYSEVMNALDTKTKTSSADMEALVSKMDDQEKENLKLQAGEKLGLKDSVHHRWQLKLSTPSFLYPKHATMFPCASRTQRFFLPPF